MEFLHNFALDAGKKTLVELSQPLDMHANQIKQWKDQLLEGATGFFGDEAKTVVVEVVDLASRRLARPQTALLNQRIRVLNQKVRVRNQMSAICFGLPTT